MSDERILKDWIDSWVDWHKQLILDLEGQVDALEILTEASHELVLLDEANIGSTVADCLDYLTGKAMAIWDEHEIQRIMREQNVTRNQAYYVRMAEKRVAARKQAEHDRIAVDLDANGLAI
jgi:hypothetical protein